VDEQDWAILGYLGVALLVVYFIFHIVTLFGSDDEHVVTVQKKWRDLIYDCCDDYLFSDESGNVYIIENSILKGAINVSERYNKIQPEHTYYIKTFGKPSLFREYPNAYYIKELTRESEIMPVARFSRPVLSNQFMRSYAYSLEDQGNSGARDF